MAFSVSKGTVILAVNTEGGIVLGSDSRSSGKEKRDDEVKIVEVGPHTLAAVRGDVALTDEGFRYLLTNHLSHMLTDRIAVVRPESTAAANVKLASDLTARCVMKAIHPLVSQFEADWNEAAKKDDVEGAKEGIRSSLQKPGIVSLGVTVAQVEEDGYQVLIDLVWIVRLDEPMGPITFEFKRDESEIRIGFYSGPKSFFKLPKGCGDDPPDWDGVVPVVDWVKQSVELVSSRCEDVGGPAQIARATSKGVDLDFHG
jgi:hypothetical protein